ncbi:MAG: hypothetical protein HY962_00860 [Ignavibacteriae bacterium]|nr:hypothetical protein [Ignavibacteriota bacterium]
MALACAWFDEESLHYSFFTPELHRAEYDRPFFRSFRTLYTQMTKDDNISDFTQVNVGEWRDYLGVDVDTADIAFLLGGARIGQIDTLIRRQGTAIFPAAASLSSNSILKARDARAARDFLFFLGYAKRCEPYATFIPGWEWEVGHSTPDPRTDVTALNALASSGLRAMSNARDPFVRARYLFQVLRLRFHARQYDACVKLYHDRASEFSPGRSVAWRAMAYAAGAFHRMKRFEDANLLFMRAREGCPTLRVVSHLGYHPLSGAAWTRCLARAASPRERAVLWQMQGVYGDPVEAMNAIAALDPSSDLLDLLLVRAINIAEESFMPDPFGYGSPGTKEDYAFRVRALDPGLIALVDRMAVEPRVRSAPLWNLAAGYLRVIAGRYADAAEFLRRARIGAQDDILVAEQARSISIVSRIETAAYPDPAFEMDIVPELLWLRDSLHTAGLRAQRVYDWALKRLSRRYESQGDAVRAQCLLPASAPDYHRDPVKRRALLALMDKTEKTDFEKFLLGQYPFSKKDIVEVQAVELLYKYRFEEAVEMFDSFPASGSDTLPGDPFLIHINDCHDCDHAAPQAVRYTKADFARRMVALKREIERDHARASAGLFTLANGIYNMSYFGNARRLYETAIFPYGLQDLNAVRDGHLTAIMDCSTAESAYKAAMQRSTDAEFQARCAFMAAKCEQNIYFMTRGGETSDDFRAGTWFTLLRDRYATTEYYKDIIRECGYFRTFTSKK